MKRLEVKGLVTMFNIIEFLYLHQKNNLVYYDSLTGTRSRMYYDRVVARKYQDKSVKIIYIHINNLKKVNDKQGHDYGDRYVKNIADELSKIEAFDELCRVGRDEFVAICDPKSKHYEIQNVENISYGVYIKHEYETVYQAVQNADRRMYNHKKKNKEKD